MRVSRSLALVCLSLALCLGSRAAAQPPNGSYDGLSIGGANEIFVPGGENTFCPPPTEAGDSACILTDLSTSAVGLVSGSGNFQLHLVDLFDGNTPFQVAGIMSGTPAAPKVKLELHGDSQGTFHGSGFDLPVPAAIDGKFKCENPSPHAPLFTCKGRLALCFLALGQRFCAGGRVPIEVAAQGGPWLLQMNATTDGKNRVTGSANLQLSNTSADLFQVTGKYNPKTDQSSLKLVSTTPGNHDTTRFSKITVSGTSIVSGDLKFKLAHLKGQTSLVP